MITAIAKPSVGRPQIIDPDKIWPEVLTYIASGDALSTALKRLDPAPSYSWAKVLVKTLPLLLLVLILFISYYVSKILQDISENQVEMQ